MRHPARRWAVLLVAVAAAAGACYWVFDLERQSLSVRQQALAATAHATALDQAVTDARRAVAAMASPGQAAVSWSRQASTALDAVREHLGALAAGPDAGGVGSIGDVLEKLIDAEGRVREHAVNGKSLMASDVAFGEALPLLDRVHGAVTEARARIGSDADAAMERLRGQQVLGIAGALAVLVLAGFALVGLPASDSATAAPSLPAAEPAADLPLETGGLSLRESPAPSAAPQRLLDVEQLAAVCTDLAATTSESAVSSALTRVASTLGASGVVLWLADRQRRVLSAAAATGYDAKILARFGEVPFEDANPTSRAAAGGVAITSAATAGHPASLAVPMVGPDGVVGVLSAELTAATVRPDVAAAARIAAAQFATVLAPPPPAVTAPSSDLSVTGR